MPRSARRRKPVSQEGPSSFELVTWSHRKTRPKNIAVCRIGSHRGPITEPEMSEETWPCTETEIPSRAASALQSNG